MGITIEFFSAHPQELIDVFAVAEDNLFVETLKHYPIADFSLHLYLPEDMDRLCLSMKNYELDVPSVFCDMLVEQLWDDRSSAESLILVSERFTFAWERTDNSQLEHIAADWITEFHYQEALHHTPAYKALLALREVARDVVAHRTSLILHLLGSSLL